MDQGREPVFLVWNRGNGTYSIENHIVTFERQPTLSDSNSYITNYMANPNQVKSLDGRMDTSITYQDIHGNSLMNVGPIFSEVKSSESKSTDEL